MRILVDRLGFCGCYCGCFDRTFYMSSHCLLAFMGLDDLLLLVDNINEVPMYVMSLFLTVFKIFHIFQHLQ